MTNELKENLSEMLFNRDERLLDYITNLQEENEYNNFCNEKLREKITNLEYKISTYENIEQRIDKAIEYIETNKEPLHHYFDEPDCDYWIATNPQDIIDILRGDE